MSLESTSTYGTINWQDSAPSPKPRAGLFKSLKRTFTKKSKKNGNFKESQPLLSGASQPFSPASIAELGSRFGPMESAKKLARAVLKWLQLLVRKLTPASNRYSRADLTAAEELALYETFSEPVSACTVIRYPGYVRPEVAELTWDSDTSSTCESFSPPQSAYYDSESDSLYGGDLDCYLPSINEVEVQEYLRSGVVPECWGLPMPFNNSLAALACEECPEKPRILLRRRHDPVELTCSLDEIEFFGSEMMFSAADDFYPDGYLGADGYANPVGIFNGGQFPQEGVPRFAADAQFLPQAFQQAVPQAMPQANPQAAPRPDFGKRFLDELRKQPEMTTYGMTQAEDGRDRSQYVVNEVPQELYSEGYILFAPIPQVPAPMPAPMAAPVEGPSRLIWNQPGQTPAASFNPFAATFDPFGAVRDAFSCGDQFGGAFDPFGPAPNPLNPVFDAFGQ